MNVVNIGRNTSISRRSLFYRATTHRRSKISKIRRASQFFAILVEKKKSNEYFRTIFIHFFAFSRTRLLTVETFELFNIQEVFWSRLKGGCVCVLFTNERFVSANVIRLLILLARHAVQATQQDDARLLIIHLNVLYQLTAPFWHKKLLFCF